MATMIINGVSVEMEINTGAECSTIPIALYYSAALGWYASLIPSPITPYWTCLSVLLLCLHWYDCFPHFFYLFNQYISEFLPVSHTIVMPSLETHQFLFYCYLLHYHYSPKATPTLVLIFSGISIPVVKFLDDKVQTLASSLFNHLSNVSQHLIGYYSKMLL